MSNKKELIESPTEYCASTIELKKTIESGFIALGERLARIKSEKMWESQWNSLSEYLAEMAITDATASKMIAVYETYVKKFGLDEKLLVEAGWSTLYEARDLVSGSSREEAEATVRKVSLLKRDDTRQLVREHKHGECDHNWFEVHIRQCRNCHRREQIEGA